MKAIILAGGSGSRLWPLSREQYPKQLLKIEEEYSLLQNTFLRLNKIVDEKDILSITNIKHLSDVKMQIRNISSDAVIIGEPSAKNTAPAIYCALEYFVQNDVDPDELILVVPADHFIKNTTAFAQTVHSSKSFAQEGYIVTFGIKPSYPETGYGYVKVLKEKGNGFIVEKFVEKPDFETAQKYMQSGNYYWNGGMFLAKLSTWISEFERLTPDIVKNRKNLNFKQNEKIPYSAYEEMPSVSVDYAIMEKASKIALVPLQSDWNDLGSWQAIYGIKEKDTDGNVIIGHAVTNNVKNSLVYSQKELIAVSDLENVIIVETEDAIMACDINKTQNVKTLYEKLKEDNITKLHKTVFRPWGYYTCLNEGEGYLTKMICVMPKQKLSVQSHNHRSEHWVVLEGKATVIKDDRQYSLYAGDSIDIPVNMKHSLQNPHDEELKIIEVQKGDYISEDDIVRYNDIYGRV